jgi:hypothetical protein
MTKCPECSGECYRDEVDIGVGTMYGPWRCSECGWYEGHQFDSMIDADIEEGE